MIITTPVTDYIPASILTAQGDIVIRDATDPIRLARSGDVAFLRNYSSGAHPTWGPLIGTIDHYWKCKGAGVFPAFETLALRDTGIFIGNNMRSSAGAQVISGIGFEPSVIIFLAIDNTSANYNWSVGFDDGVNGGSIFSRDTGADIVRDTNESLYLRRDINNRIFGHVTAMEADGFTITWTLVGALPCGFLYLCFP